MSPATRVQEALVLLAVLGLALFLRISTLDIPHFYTDEPWGEGLAASLLESRTYSLEHVGVNVLDHAAPGLALLELVPVPQRRGAVLAFYASGGQEDVVTQAVRAPLFPAILAASVATIGSGHVTTVAVNDAMLEGHTRAQAYAAARLHDEWRRAQLPLTLPPLLASLAAVALAYAGARALRCSLLAAFLAALALATSPVEAWCAHRVTADTLTELVVGGAALAAAFAIGRSPARAAIAGGVAGFAVLAKASALLAVPAYVAAEVMLLAARREDAPGTLRRLAAFVGGWVAGGFWFPLAVYGVTRDWGRALGVGGAHVSPLVDTAPWGVLTHTQPFWAVLWTNVRLSPVLVIGGLAGFAILGAPSLRPRTGWLGIASFAAVFCGITAVHAARETRYLLPAYVPLALGLAAACDGARALLARQSGTRTSTVVVLALMLPPLGYAAVQARDAGPSGAWELRDR